MSIASRPRPGAGGVPIIPADAVGPVLPAGPPIDFHLEEEDGIPAGFAPPPVNPDVLLVIPFEEVFLPAKLKDYKADFS